MKRFAVVLFLCATGISTPGRACDWGRSLSIERDDMAEYERAFNEDARANNAPVAVRAVGYSFKGPAANVPYSTRLACLNDRVSQVGIALVERRFKEASESDLAAMGITKERVFQQLKQRMPFGERDQLSDAFNDFRVFTAEPACASAGLVAAYLAITYPQQGDGTDYGSIGVMLTGLGRCSSPTLMSGYFMDRAEREVDARVRQQ